ncbi:hypothetical protein Hanom_Chr08g00748081 [Helianthus anomalus]
MNMQIIINGYGHSFCAIWTLHDVLVHLLMLVEMHHFILFSHFATFPFLHQATQSNCYESKEKNTSKRNKNYENGGHC